MTTKFHWRCPEGHTISVLSDKEKTVYCSECERKYWTDNASYEEMQTLNLT
jgi:hypothetical protein